MAKRKKSGPVYPAAHPIAAKHFEKSHKAFIARQKAIGTKRSAQKKDTLQRFLKAKTKATNAARVARAATKRAATAMSNVKRISKLVPKSKRK